MTPTERTIVARAARLLRSGYQAQGDDRATAARHALEAFRAALDGTSQPRRRDVPKIGLAVDAVGVVMLALRSAGIDVPGPALAESIHETARRALGGWIDGGPS